MGIAKHFETGESLPEDVYLKLVAARTFRAGSFSLRQVRTNVLVYHSFLYFYLNVAYATLISLSIYVFVLFTIVSCGFCATEAEIYTVSSSILHHVIANQLLDSCWFIVV